MSAKINVKDYVKLGRYKGLKQPKNPVEVAEEEMAEFIEQMRYQRTRKFPVEDRPAADGDTVTIDFEGFVDGTAFAGGKGSDYELLLGSHSFIDTFEEQLIGSEVGSKVDVNVTFPERYQAEELAGKPALFKVEVKAIFEQKVPEFDDAYVLENFGMDMEHFRAQIEEKIKANKMQAAEDAYNQGLLRQVMDQAEASVPEELIEASLAQQMNSIQVNLSQQGMNLEQYLQMMGLDREQFTARLRPQAEQESKMRLVLEAIAEAEGIKVDDDEVNEYVGRMAAAYSMDVDQLMKEVNEEAREMIRSDVSIQKAMDVIFTSALEV